MRIAIYHPNLNLFGGGERVALTMANLLSGKHNVTIFTTANVDKKKMEDFFKIRVDNINFVLSGRVVSKLPSLTSVKPALLLKSNYRKLEKYDLVIDTCTNGWF